MSYEVGQTVWYEPFGKHQHGRALVITKVGRKWATCGEGWQQTHFDKMTGLEKPRAGYCPDGKVYPSREAFDDESRLTDAWSKFRRFVSATNACPEEMTIEKIAAMRTMIVGENP